MIGGLAGRALSTQGGFMGNSGGLAGGLVGQMLPPINPGAHRDQMRQKKIYDKGRGTDNPNEADTFLRRTGPQLPPLADGFGGMFAGPQQGQAGPMLGAAGQMIQNPNFGLVGQLTGINQAGNNQGLAALGGQPVVSKFNDPMTIKSVY